MSAILDSISGHSSRSYDHPVCHKCGERDVRPVRREGDICAKCKPPVCPVHPGALGSWPMSPSRRGASWYFCTDKDEAGNWCTVQVNAWTGEVEGLD